MYVDMMQQVMRSTTKVYVDTKDGNNLLYLPFDKLMERNRQQGEAAAQEALAVSSNNTSTNSTATKQAGTVDNTANSAANDYADLRTLRRSR